MPSIEIHSQYRTVEFMSKFVHLLIIFTCLIFSLDSGEKTTTEEWPMLLEIKGRVRLDAFEKFVRELPNSRSRAVMVLFYCLQFSHSLLENCLLG